MNTIRGTVKRYMSHGTDRLGRPCANIFAQSLMGCLFALALSPAIQAAEFSCPSFMLVGDVDCLIRNINMANTNGQANTITLESGNYILTTNEGGLLPDGFNGLPSITSTLTIKGQGPNGPNSTTISRALGTPSMPTPDFRIFHVADEASLTLTGLAIVNGEVREVDPILRPSAGFGGGIFVRDAGNLTLNDVFVVGNRAADSGGGIFNGTPFFNPNLGILVVPGTGRLTMTKSALQENTAFSGGGILISNDQNPLIIVDSLIEGNNAVQGDGGGIRALAGAEITNSTISFNRAVRGGGIDAVGGGAFINSTISNNSASGAGGGIHGGPVDLVNVTISNNTAGDPGGGGISASEPIWRIKNSLIVNNPVGGNCARFPNSVETKGHNIDSDNTCGFSDPTDRPGV